MWTFIQDQVLGMKWLNALIENLLTALGLDITGKIGSSIQFFIYDALFNIGAVHIRCFVCLFAVW